jgi:2-phospho-L-lactate/phosphoenolpyruvate guanylyltransferase
VLTVIPFKAEGKSRLPEDLRREVALAMLGDVVEVALAVGDVRVVTDDPAGRLVAGDLGARLVDDPGGGQGEAVATGLAGASGLCLVVNADVPRVRPSDLNALAVPALLGRLGIVEAADGTTNALGLPRAELFAPLYGAGSAGRFRKHAAGLGIDAETVALENLVGDVDTLADLVRFGSHAGARTAELVEAIAL